MSAPSPVVLTARERRELAKLASRITQWWEATPVPQRLPYYRPAVISDECRVPLNKIGAPLRHLGWRRAQVRFDRICTVVWVAPGAVSPLRAVGRPRKATPTESTQPYEARR